MREILFRGKRIDNGEWVYGDLIHGVGWKEGRLYILPLVKNLASLGGCDPLDGYNVIPDTIGQFTGLTDKHEVWIFEGDKVAHNIATQNNYNVANNKFFVITFKGGAFCLTALDYVGSDDSITIRDAMVQGKQKGLTLELEVIGNIHDNQQ